MKNKENKTYELFLIYKSLYIRYILKGLVVYY